MNGVIILNEFEAVIGYTWGFSFIGLLLCLFALVLSFAELISFIKNRKIKKTKVHDHSYGLDMAVCFAIFGILNFSTAKEIVEPQYEIYIPGEINMTEFSEKYEIVDRRGLIYTVREVNNEEGH